MTRSLHLIVTTPAKVLAEADNVVSVRADDESGGFGILPGHAYIFSVLAMVFIGAAVAGEKQESSANQTGN